MSNKGYFKFSLAMMIVFAMMFTGAVAILVFGAFNTVGILFPLTFLIVMLGFIAAMFTYATIIAYHDRNLPDIY